MRYLENNAFDWMSCELIIFRYTSLATYGISSIILLLLGAYSTALGTPIGTFAFNFSSYFRKCLLWKCFWMYQISVMWSYFLIGFGIDRPSKYINVATLFDKQVRIRNHIRMIYNVLIISHTDSIMLPSQHLYLR